MDTLLARTAEHNQSTPANVGGGCVILSNEQWESVRGLLSDVQAAQAELERLADTYHNEYETLLNTDEISYRATILRNAYSARSSTLYAAAGIVARAIAAHRDILP